jgi:hypothetical protein
MYYSGIKGLDLLISGKKNSYVVDVTQPMPHVEQLVGNQYPIKVPTSRLKQLVPIAIGVHVQQTMIVVLPINILENGLDYMSMVMVFQSNSLEGLIHIHSRMENHLEVCLMEDC